MVRLAARLDVALHVVSRDALPSTPESSNTLAEVSD